MKALEERGLVNVVPELLIEKAAQLSNVKGHLEDPSYCLDNALDQLTKYPVNDTTDAQLRERTLSQLRELVEQCEQQKTYPVAEQVYLRILDAYPDDLWSKYRLARSRFMQGKISQGAARPAQHHSSTEWTARISLAGSYRQQRQKKSIPTGQRRRRAFCGQLSWRRGLGHGH